MLIEDQPVLDTLSQMTRRAFLSLLATSAAARASAQPAVKIRQILLAPIQGRFHKFVAMNAYDREPKGHTYSNTLVRIQTDQGVEGVGVMGYPAPDAAFREAVKLLVGANPLEIYQIEQDRIGGRAPAFTDLLQRYPHLDGPLFDLAGKLTGRPVWKLIGEAARERVEVYDGTLYFSDVWFSDRGARAVAEEAEEAMKRGYRGVKLKAGRGWKWMEKDAGLRRDIEVIRAVRQAAGPGLKVMADANNGFRDDFERAWRLLSETADAGIYWIEEPFPEDLAQYAALKERMQKAGLKTLLADGENMRSAASFDTYLSPRRLMDVVQLDIRTGGFLENVALARAAERAGAVSVPHNWGSQAGLLMSLHLAKAVKAVAAAEDDRSTCDVLAPEGYEFRGGSYTVPDTPGLSLRVNETVYREKYKPLEIVVS